MKVLFEKAFLSCIQSAEVLYFPNLGWTDADAQQLAHAIAYIPKLMPVAREQRDRRRRFKDLVDALVGGKSDELQHLILSNNPFASAEPLIELLRSTKVPKLRELDILRCALDDDSRKELKEACAGRSLPVKLHDGTGTAERLSKVASRIRAASRPGRAVEIHQNDQAIAERNSYIFASPDERSRSRKRWASTAVPGRPVVGEFRAVAEMLSCVRGIGRQET